MPDGTGATDQQDPGSPQEQITREIELARMGNRVFAIIGIDHRMESGGGGGGGQFMFANLDELDAVIGTWEDQLAAIEADRRQIEITRQAVSEPAGDAMSRYHANATLQSLGALAVHNEQMFAYADGYLKKLRAARQQMQIEEDAGAARMRAVGGMA